MNKLKEEGKVKTVSVDSFEQNNLVLVDEGHRGLSGDERERRVDDGPSLVEYEPGVGADISQRFRDLSGSTAEGLLIATERPACAHVS